MEITIRNVLPEEAREHIMLLNACWQSAYKGIMTDEFLADRVKQQEQRAEWLKETLIDPDCGVYCAMLGNKMIGRLVFGKSEDQDKSNTGEIVAIYLLEEFWGRGYGKEMLDFALDKLKSRGYGEIVLWVLEGNERGRRFYERHSFMLDGAKKEVQFGRVLTLLRYALEL
jgi:RimJ/RimL family protein N-acetyltransferase